MSAAQDFRSRALSQLTNEIGVYALCDLDGQPIYVGQSINGIRTRVRRHPTSARSDVIANRQIDGWEIAFVWAWPVAGKAEVAPLKKTLFDRFDREQPLMNGKGLAVTGTVVTIPEKQPVQIIDEGERINRLTPSQRLPRQIQQYNLLVDYILTVKNAPHLKVSLDAHFQRLIKYHQTFL